MASDFGLVSLVLALMITALVPLLFLKHAAFKTELNYNSFYFFLKLVFF